MKNILFFLSLVIINFSVKSSPFKLTIDERNSGSLTVFQQDPINLNSTSGIFEDIAGKEESECRVYGRKSSASVHSDTDVLAQSNDAISLNVNTSANSYGGHYRKCANCVWNNCLIVSGNDTNATAKASSKVNVKLEFNETHKIYDYVLQVSGVHLTEYKPTLKLIKPSGEKIDLSFNQKNSFELDSSIGSIYYLEIDSSLDTSNSGGCCSDTKTINSQIDINVLKAPILYSKGMTNPYILQGKATFEFNNVAAILLNDKLHCSAVAISKKTLLTAAHCLYGYEVQLKNMTVDFSPNIAIPSHKRFLVESFEYPQEAAGSFRYNPDSYKDDIGVIHLKESVNNITFQDLHTGSPSWNYILGNRIELSFVGYGISDINAQELINGIKRSASWHINHLEGRKVYFKPRGKNTCYGDSGGPAFIKQGDEYLLAAITSGGDEKCTRGFETRVDSYLPWINSRVKN